MAGFVLMFAGNVQHTDRCPRDQGQGHGHTTTSYRFSHTHRFKQMLRRLYTDISVWVHMYVCIFDLLCIVSFDIFFLNDWLMLVYLFSALLSKKL